MLWQVAVEYRVAGRSERTAGYLHATAGVDEFLAAPLDPTQ
ncbi:MAG: hypothetical protein ABI645_12320 [Pseudomonadota bacterium]